MISCQDKKKVGMWREESNLKIYEKLNNKPGSIRKNIPEKSVIKMETRPEPTQN